MFPEYRPYYYANIDAETNRISRSEHPNDGSPLCEEPGKTVFFLGRHSAEIRIFSENFRGTTAVRQRTVIENKGKEPFVADALSSIYQCGIGGDEKGFYDGRFTFHYAHSVWQGEAQWRHVPAEQLGLYRTHNHGTQTSFRLSSSGTWTTCRYEPVLMIEDMCLKKTWIFTCESGSAWSIDVSVRGQREDLSLAVFVSGSWEENGGWHVTLAPGETYETCSATVDLVDGGFEEAAQALVSYGRAAVKSVFPEKVPPLCFNDYMNCIWALPTEEKCRALIAAAEAAGCEYYVIDAGWFGEHPDWGRSLGDWNANDGLFGKGGLAGIFRLIEQAGMKPGIWLEIESVNAGSAYAGAHPDHLLKRHGKVIGGSVCFLDYRIKEVRDYIEGVIDGLYGMGVRFIKNDYNQTVGVGIDGGNANSSPAAELEKMTREFRKFIDKIREKYPDLIIENCGSGAMRSDLGTLASFHLQSVSDQEDYFRLPSIVAGLEAVLPPERCGVWTYPYPSPIDDRMTFDRPASFTEKFADGKNTSYNMVTGLMGLMYLSGRIDRADAGGMALIRQACDIYKKNREVMSRSVPVYPLGTFDMSARGVLAYGLLSRTDGKLLIAVWNQESSGRTVSIDLSKYISEKSLPPMITCEYPRLPGMSAELSGAVLNVSLPGGKTAMYVEVSAH